MLTGLLLVAPLALQVGISPDAVRQTAYIKAVQPDFDDHFGNDLDLSGERLIVGMPSADSGVLGDPIDDSLFDAGGAWIYGRQGGSWAMEAYLQAPTPKINSWFGLSVAIDGDRAVVGSPLEQFTGVAHVYHHDGSSWLHEGTLLPHNATTGDRFGQSVAISGTTVVVGAIFEDGSGSGVNPPSDDQLGGAGAAYVFELEGGTWLQSTYLKASNPGANDRFGRVAISGDRIAVAASDEDSAATGIDGDGSDDTAQGAGAVYLFRRGPGTWLPDAYVKASNTSALQVFGGSLDLDGTTLVVGAAYEQSAATGVDGDESDTSMKNAGAAYVFEADATGTWAQTAYLKASNTEAFDLFGQGVAVSGDLIVVGASGEDGAGPGTAGDPSSNTRLNSGAAYAFRRTLGGWQGPTYLKADLAGVADGFGGSLYTDQGGVALDGATLAVAAVDEDSSSGGLLGIGGDQSDDGALSSGAVYTFDLGLRARVTSYGPGAPAHPVVLSTVDEPTTGQPLTLDVSDPGGAGFALLVLAAAPDAAPHFGGTLLVDWTSLLLPPPGTVSVPLAAGLGSKALLLPPGSAGLTLYAQAVVPAHQQPAGLALSNGLALTVGP